MSDDNTFKFTDEFIEDTFDWLIKLTWENDLELSTEKPKSVMGHHLYVRQGTNRTSFLNFADVCKKINRQPDHVMAFLLAGLGASGSLHRQRWLLVDGRFPAQDFEEIMRRYATEYVICIECKSPDTTLSEDNCLFFLRCEKCGAVQSVAPVQQGSPSNMADLSLNEGKDKVVADISPFDPTEKKKKKKKKKQKKQKKQERVGEDEGIVPKTPHYTWHGNIHGYACHVFN